ncbi:hypothetical protein SAMN02927916_4513 [Flavobacterium anhuiense]|uniref:Uncharacterized protein n=1 Tax=Flavobacterium anhuiense TaxID=459526 RepID=A0ABY0M3W0_9FLAO|nr:hypothetical protein [Flavobacterium anhuiense]SCY98293.1 hypothetical protein SAMN02927916_4513 [Flavobacterium anhuiense]
MLELIWGILNVILFLGLLVFCAKKAAEIRAKVGLSVAILFSFFALSFITRPSNEEKDKKFEFENREIEKQSSNRNTYLSKITLEDDLCTKFQLNIICDGENARSALIQRTGFIGGTEWSTLYININKTEREKTFEYQIGGTRKWKILGVEIYSEYKEFSGMNEFKPLSSVL